MLWILKSCEQGELIFSKYLVLGGKGWTGQELIFYTFKFNSTSQNDWELYSA